MRVPRGGGAGGLLGGLLPGGFGVQPRTVQLGPTHTEVTAILVGGRGRSGGAGAERDAWNGGLGRSLHVLCHAHGCVLCMPGQRGLMRTGLERQQGRKLPEGAAVCRCCTGCPPCSRAASWPTSACTPGCASAGTGGWRQRPERVQIVVLANTQQRRRMLRTTAHSRSARLLQYGEQGKVLPCLFADTAAPAACFARSSWRCSGWRRSRRSR